MGAETKGIEDVKRARRAAIRSVDLIASGAMGEQEVDFARMLFGETQAEERLAPFGLLDDGGILDGLVRRVEMLTVTEYERFRPVAALAERIEARLLELQAERDQKAERGELSLPNGLPRKVPRAERKDVAERNARTSRQAAARLLAVHLSQRALYEGLNRALETLVARQMTGDFPKDPAAAAAMRLPLGHGPIAMGAGHVAAADVAIARLRKPHMADHPPRADVSFGIAAGWDAPTLSPEERDRLLFEQMRAAGIYGEAHEAPAEAAE